MVQNDWLTGLPGKELLSWSCNTGAVNSGIACFQYYRPAGDMKTEAAEAAEVAEFAEVAGIIVIIAEAADIPAA